MKKLTENLDGIRATCPGKLLDVYRERDRSGQRICEIIIRQATSQRVKVLIDPISREIHIGGKTGTMKVLIVADISELAASIAADPSSEGMIAEIYGATSISAAPGTAACHSH